MNQLPNAARHLPICATGIHPNYVLCSMLRTLTLLPVILLFCAGCNNPQTKKGESVAAPDSTIAKFNSPALKQANDALRANPVDPNLYLQRGKVYLELRDFDAAVADGERALKLDSMKDSYYLFLTDAYFYNNKTRQAKEILERCVKNLPNSSEGYLKLAELYFYVKKYQESINAVNSALKIDENLAKGYFLKGMCYKESGDTGRAISSLQTACEQDNQYYDAYIETGRMLLQKKNPLGIEYLNNALRIDPKSTEAIYIIAKFYQDAGQVKKAEEAYNKLLAMDKKYASAWYNLGAIEFYMKRDRNKAKEYFTEAINADPQYAEAYFARGACYESLKDEDNAIADYKEAIKYRVNYEDAIANLNRLLDKQKGK
jgi:tetratricopeptide (TPR) repeat protein